MPIYKRKKYHRGDTSTFKKSHFIDRHALEDHFNQKSQKRQLKALELEPYSIEDSERASGKGNFILPKKRKIETIASSADINPNSEGMRIDE